MAFIESPRFPDEIAAWLVGGRSFQTVVTETYGGNEYRNAAWTYARGVWDVAEALRTLQDSNAYAAKTLFKFWMVAKGQLNGFRLKAPFDNSDDGMGILGSGTSASGTTVYQVNKKYAIGSDSHTQIVRKPVSTGFVVLKNGTPVSGANWTLDATTGVVTFTGGAQGNGDAITWTGSYDVPVRFAGDSPGFGLDQSGALMSWQGLKLIELVNP